MHHIIPNSRIYLCNKHTYLLINLLFFTIGIFPGWYKTAFSPAAFFLLLFSWCFMQQDTSKIFLGVHFFKKKDCYSNSTYYFLEMGRATARPEIQLVSRVFLAARANFGQPGPGWIDRLCSTGHMPKIPDNLAFSEKNWQIFLSPPLSNTVFFSRELI